MDLDALDPLHPLEPASPGGDEAARRAVAVGERLPADVRGEQQGARVTEAEAPAVTGARDHSHVTSPGLDAGLVEQAAERDAAPVLGREEAARAVQRGGQRIAAVQLGGGDGEPAAPAR